MANLRLSLPEGFSSRARLVVGVSGGCDSLALLQILVQNTDPKKMIAAHVNYGLRGKESRADEAFVRKICAQRGVVLRVLRVRGLEKKIKKEKSNLQEEARKIRYSFFSRLVQKEKSWGAAVAHHLEDQAETVMDRFLRGTGAKGLSGLRRTQMLHFSPYKPLKVWRPLLGYTKDELKSYLRSQNIVWREDRSNQKMDYRRNQIRHLVLPFLTRWNSNLIQSLSRMGEVAAEENRFLEEWAKESGVRLQGKWSKKSYVCSQKKFRTADLVLQRRWARQVAERLNPDARGLSFDRVELILRLWNGDEKGPRDVGYGLPAGLVESDLYLKNVGLWKK